ncbi:hypothetical protein E2C01_034178 [Portunus trituberculatus]|uniref:Uncharacterized protein n=1 Tax=Portunus trituberculatus TaxID=210409 RepID=A0A5B7F4W9_PORTR|nr:hypothetical protein [Portunus trituberculatus]
MTKVGKKGETETERERWREGERKGGKKGEEGVRKGGKKAEEGIVNGQAGERRKDHPADRTVDALETVIVTIFLQYRQDRHFEERVGEADEKLPEGVNSDEEPEAESHVMLHAHRPLDTRVLVRQLGQAVKVARN